MPGKYERALDAQVELIKFWKSDFGGRFAQAFGDSILSKNGLASTGFGESMGRAQAHYLDQAETYWVSATMGELVEVASRSMPPQPLKHVDLVTPSGFAYLDRIVYVTDARGKRCGVKAFSWHPAMITDPNGGEPTEAVSVAWYSSKHDPQDEDIAEYPEAWSATMPELVLLHYSPWWYGAEWGTEDERFVLGSVTDLRRYVAAWWSLIQQPIAYSSAYRPARPWRRRLERDGLLTKQASEIRVVTLRKYRDRPQEEPLDEHEEQLWSHRWLVSGHWRNQWVPSIDDHRLTWISPYVKGPEHLPLIQKDKVFRWVR